MSIGSNVHALVRLCSLSGAFFVSLIVLQIPPPLPITVHEERTAGEALKGPVYPRQIVVVRAWAGNNGGVRTHLIHVCEGGGRRMTLQDSKARVDANKKFPIFSSRVLDFLRRVCTGGKKKNCHSRL